VPIVFKSGSLNFLKPLGPVQACNGIALPLMFNDPSFFTAKELFLNTAETQRKLLVGKTFLFGYGHGRSRG
jgi:hypothetical protein